MYCACVPCQNCSELPARVSITPVERPSLRAVPPRAKASRPAVSLLVFKLGIRASAKVPVVIFAVSKLGISAATSALKVGLPLLPSGAPKNLFAV